MGRCLLCDLPAAHLHHLTGRPAPGQTYYDRALRVPVCSDCHNRLHVVLRRLGLECPGENALQHRLHRVAEFVHGLADYDRGLVLDLSSTRALGELLSEAVRLIALHEEEA